MMMKGSYFDFERLDVFRLAVEVARTLRTARWPAKTSALQDQATRAADSVVLNIAEGSASSGRQRAKHFDLALGSAGEALAATLLVELADGDELREKLRRVRSMLKRLR
jgi:four helix bundle protein